MKTLDSEELWKRVGLEQLRESLNELTTLVKSFEQSLRALPSCDSCARSALLKQIYKSGDKLGSKVISITLIADTVKKVVAAAELSQGQLKENAPSPCRCPESKCTCHK